MPTKWVVTTPGDHIDLDETRQAETTFTVTNPTTRVDRVVFDIAAGDGADMSWFTVDQPQRRVPPSGSVSYLVKTVVPADAKAGSYSVQGRAYSADSAPEEDSVLSSRLVIEIAAKAQPAAKKKLPKWWIYVVAGLVAVVVLVVAGVFIFGGTKQVTAPDVTNEPVNQAKTNLSVFGLTVGQIHYVQSATGTGVVVGQSVVGGTKVSQDKPVDLIVTASLAAPVPVAPSSGATVAPSQLVGPTAPVPTAPSQFTALESPSPAPSAGTVTTGVLRWTDSDPFVTAWQITIAPRICLDPFGRQCTYAPAAVIRLNQPSYTPILVKVPAASPTPAPPAPIGQFNVYPNTTYEWSVSAVDDFGNVGPASPLTTYVVQ